MIFYVNLHASILISIAKLNAGGLCFNIEQIFVINIPLPHPISIIMEFNGKRAIYLVSAFKKR